MSNGIKYYYKGFNVPLEDNPTYEAWHKFGRNASITNGTTEDIWGYGGTYTYDTSAIACAISSSAVADTQTYKVYGRDASWNAVNTVVNANGRTAVALPYQWIRVFRIENVGKTDNAGTIYVHDATDTLTNGVPDTPRQSQSDHRGRRQPDQDGVLHRPRRARRVHRRVAYGL